MKSSKDKIIETFRKRMSDLGKVANYDQKITDQEVAVLLGELQIAQIELEMQNDELMVSAQLLENERAKFAGFFNLAPFGYFILDHRALVSEVNKAGVSLLALPKDKIIEQRFQSFISPEHWDLFYNFLYRLSPDNGRKAMEIKLTLASGQEIYTRMEGIAIKNSYTDQLQYYVTVIDMTKERSAQQKLRETTQRLEMTLNASETGTWTVDVVNRKVFFDNFSLSLLEINNENFDGTLQTFINLVHPDDRSNVQKSLIENIDELKKINFDFRVINKEGQVNNLSAKGQLIDNSNNTPYLAGIIFDVTSKRQIEQAAKELQEEKQKLVLSTTFSAQEKERNKISSILHDSICQLLYGIKLNLQHIQNSNQAPDFKNVHSLLAQAIKETRELSYELIPSVLRDFGFKAGIREMVDRLNTPYFKISLQISEEANSLPQNLQLPLFRIIQELLNNCIKHAEASLAEINFSVNEKEITIMVIDNGKGFSTDVESELTKGSGLRGIKNRVFLLNGELDIDTSPKGSAITIKFKNES